MSEQFKLQKSKQNAQIFPISSLEIMKDERWKEEMN